MITVIAFAALGWLCLGLLLGLIWISTGMVPTRAERQAEADANRAADEAAFLEHVRDELAHVDVDPVDPAVVDRITRNVLAADEAAHPTRRNP